MIGPAPPLVAEAHRRRLKIIIDIVANASATASRATRLPALTLDA